MDTNKIKMELLQQLMDELKDKMISDMTAEEADEAMEDSETYGKEMDDEDPLKLLEKEVKPMTVNKEVMDEMEDDTEEMDDLFSDFVKVPKKQVKKTVIIKK